MNMNLKNYLFHIVAYYAAWFGAILLAASNQASYATLTASLAVMCQIVWQHNVAKRTQGLWLMISLFVFFGTISDTVIMQMGLIEFAANPFADYLSAPWMSALWASFAITFYSLLPWFFERYLLVGFLSLLSFPIAYAAGAALHAATLPHGYMSSIIIGMIWAVVFPLILKIFHGIRVRSGGAMKEYIP